MSLQSARQTQEQLWLADVMMVARAAGYTPTNAHVRAGMVWLTFANPTDSYHSPRVAVADRNAPDILQTLRDYAGAANQPATPEQAAVTEIAVRGTRVVVDLCVPQGSYQPCGEIMVLNPTDYAQLQQELAQPSAGRVNRTHIHHIDIPAIECGLLESVVRRYENYRPGMIDAVIAEQVKAGGVDTEGSRAQAERWLAMVCACVCSGLRATTLRSRFHDTRSDVLGWEDHLDVRNPSPRLGVP